VIIGSNGQILVAGGCQVMEEQGPPDLRTHGARRIEFTSLRTGGRAVQGRREGG